LPDGDSIAEGREHAFLKNLCDRLQAETPLSAGEIGPGDDGAVFAPQDGSMVATTDALVENVHFRSGWVSPEELGCRAVAANLSDLAAMGATPTRILLSLILPETISETTTEALTMAVAHEARNQGAILAGGNLSRGAELSITITALGRLDGPALLRSGASPDELLVVTGNLGDAALAVHLWESGEIPGPALREKFTRPKPRLRAGQVLARAGATSAIDISDGLLADLGHLCRASGVGAVVERESLPRSSAVDKKDQSGADFAANGGEDYELLVTLPRSLDRDLAKLAGQCGIGLSVIGSTTDQIGSISLMDGMGAPHRPTRHGFDHFARETS